MHEIIELINYYFRPILVVIGALVGLLLALKKFGYKISFRYTYSVGHFTEKYISNVVLTNHKDKNISIWAIYAVLDKDLVLTLSKFDPPLNLKPYETMGIKLPKYSSLYVGTDKYEPKFYSELMEILVDVGEKNVKCEAIEKRDNTDCYKKIQKSIDTFGGHVLNHHVAYVMQYELQGKTNTAFISNSGMIGNEWDFPHIRIENKEVNSDTIKSVLIEYELNKVFSSIICYSVGEHGAKFEFEMHNENTS
jgi:hypothetical protein